MFLVSRRRYVFSFVAEPVLMVNSRAYSVFPFCDPDTPACQIAASLVQLMIKELNG